MLFDDTIWLSDSATLQQYSICVAITEGDMYSLLHHSSQIHKLQT